MLAVGCWKLTGGIKTVGLEKAPTVFLFRSFHLNLQPVWQIIDHSSSLNCLAVNATLLYEEVTERLHYMRFGDPVC